MSKPGDPVERREIQAAVATGFNIHLGGQDDLWEHHQVTMSITSLKLYLASICSLMTTFTAGGVINLHKRE